MAGRRRKEALPDPYETAVGRIDAQRRVQEMGDPMPGMPPGLDAPLNTGRLRTLALVLAAVLAVLVVGQIARSGGQGGDCSKVAFHLSDTSVPRGDGVRWTASGQAAQSYRVRVEGGPLVTSGHSAKGCAATGLFVANLPAGSYPVLLVDTAGHVVARERLTVTA